MYLSDRDLAVRGPDLIRPFDPRRVQPASYDLTLGDTLLIPAPGMVRDGAVDPDGDVTPFVPCPLGPEGLVLASGSVALATTAETVRVPEDLAARVEGKSTWARWFVQVHVSAGWLDPGFAGQVTLEIVNHGPWPVRLRPGTPIAQVNFCRLTTAAARPYGHPALGSHYQGQQGPTAPRPLIPVQEQSHA